MLRLEALISLLILALSAAPTGAETGRFNIHLEGAVGLALADWQREELGPGVSGSSRLEYPLTEWVGIELGGGYLQFFDGDHPTGYETIEQAYLAHAGAGVRFRILNDEKGYWWPWRMNPAHVGNLWGNLWADLHADYCYTGGLNRFGADVGLGAEFSLVNGLQIGPLVRALYILQPDSVNERDSRDAWILLVGLSFSVALPPGGKQLSDSDGDGLFDLYDKCTDQAEDKDGYEDSDGCPEVDNDSDGIIDEKDRCPIYSEDLDGYQDQDGCPDQDNDADGVPDEQDKCPLIAEDRDGREDNDGCPEVEDEDGDGIGDDIDRCPKEPETENGIEDDDGCPELDRDDDGIIDEKDGCPDKPEVINGVRDEDGCPDEGLVEVHKNRILLGKRIFFDFSSARVKSQARAVLLHLAKLIKSHPEYTLLSLEGHTDSTGDKDFNRRLSERRAENVKEFLIKQGVEPERLVVKVFGESHPWIRASADDELKKNRRVEIFIVDIDEGLASSPVSRETKEAVSNAKKAYEDDSGALESEQEGPTDE